MADTARKQLADALKPLLPKSWRLVPYQVNLDALSTPVVMLKLSKIEKHPAAPGSQLLTTWTITVADPHQDIEKAEDALDKAVGLLCLAVDAIPGVRWLDAQKVLFQDKYIAFDITTQMTARKEA